MPSGSVLGRRHHPGNKGRLGLNLYCKGAALGGETLRRAAVVPGSCLLWYGRTHGPRAPHTPIPPFALTLLNMPSKFLTRLPSPSFPSFQGSTSPLHVLGTLLTAFSPSSTPFSGGGAHVLPPCHRRSVSLGNPENSTPNPRPLVFSGFGLYLWVFPVFPWGMTLGFWVSIWTSALSSSCSSQVLCALYPNGCDLGQAG